MPDLNRVVAGLRCRDVLTKLADYVDGELEAGDVARVNDHLRSCDHCEKFGGEYGRLVGELRGRLAQQPALGDVGVRLRQRMWAEWEDLPKAGPGETKGGGTDGRLG